MFRHALAFTALCSIASAQMSIDGAVPGYVLDGRSAALRPVVGIPGSAYLGVPIPLPWRVAAASARAARDLAVVISAEQPRRVYLLRGLRGSTSITALDAAMPDADRVVLSPDGASAAIVNSAQQQLQLVSNLGGTPAISLPVPLALGANITAVAISRSGCALVGAGQLVEICAANPGAVVPVFQRDGFLPAAIAWLDNQRFAVADAAQNQVLLFADANGSAPTVLLDSGAGVDSPVGLVAVDSFTIAVGIAGGIIVAPTNGSAQPRTVALPLAPTMLDALDRPSILVSNPPGDLPLLLVDVQQDFSAFFVPFN